MLFRKSHNRLTRLMMGNSLPWKDVDAINQRKDNPTFQDKVFSNMMNKNLSIVPNMWGHRQYNHDIFSSILIGHKIAGRKGMQAALLHDIEDMISDELVKYYGVDGRNLFEAAMNYSFTQHRRHNRYIPRRFYW
jgi:hypothetical protein